MTNIERLYGHVNSDRLPQTVREARGVSIGGMSETIIGSYTGGVELNGGSKSAQMRHSSKPLSFENI